MLELRSLASASTSKRGNTIYNLFDEYLDTLSANSKQAYKYYMNDFKNFFKNLALDVITVNDIQSFINYKVALNLKDTTIYRYYRILKTIFNYAINHEYIEKNPCVRC